ncbi:MAG: NAD(P)H-binding protein [Coriobacteriales bacterium]|nr:NAD(P)H-binding protein [Coriobacteriales bacterium]
MVIAVLGANGRTGREVVAMALARGCAVRGLVRNAEAVELRHPDFAVVEGDARQVADVRRTIRGADAVISTLGSHRGALGPLYSLAAHATIAAAQAEGVTRIVALSSRSLSEYAEQSPQAAKASGPDVHGDLREMERLLRTSDLEVTVMRPSRLVDGNLGEYETRTGALFPPGRETRRRDLAAAMLEAVETGRWSGEDVAIVSD